MNCPNHPRNEATGYCGVCGSFGCPECLFEHQGQTLCRKHYKQAAGTVEEERKSVDPRRKHARQRLVVRYKDGRTVYGMCFALNIKDSGFYLDRVGSDGVALNETIPVRFADLKAVFYVKSFDGKFDKSVRYRDWTPEGGELIVEFQDGEVVQGYSLHHYSPDEPRFHLIPTDLTTNNISIVVERTAIAHVYTPEQYQEKLARVREERKNSKEPVNDLSQEETMGDFYFETRNYPGALEQYSLALRKFPQSSRIRKKILMAKYNVGVQHIKRRDYVRALASMEEILRTDPKNPHALKKVAQLRRIVEKEQNRDDPHPPR